MRIGSSKRWFTNLKSNFKDVIKIIYVNFKKKKLLAVPSLFPFLLFPSLTSYGAVYN